MSKTETAVATRASQAPAVITELPDDLVLVLGEHQIDPAAVNIPTVAFALPVSKADLCVIEAPTFGGLISDMMVVTKTIEFPEADRFPGYKGYVRAECLLRDGESVAWTTHLFNKATGELGPIAEYLRNVPTPAAIRLGMFESKSHPGQFVYRPVPIRVD